MIKWRLVFMRIAVVGAGIAGLLFANKSLELGAHVVVFEEHADVGVPKHCTGLVSYRTIRLVGEAAESSVENVYDFIKVTGRRSSITFRVKGGVFKLDRVKLEKNLLNHIEKMGGDIRLETRVEKVTPDGYLYYDGRVEEFDVVIIAEGYKAKLARNLGLSSNPRVIHGLNIDYDEPMKGRTIEVYWGGRFPFGFFAWVIPRGDVTTIGLGSPSPRLTDTLVRLLEEEFKLRRRIEAYGGAIILGPPAPRFRQGRVFIVGDAAALNKPLTGGGVYPNALASEVFKRLSSEGIPVARALEIALEAVARELRLSFHIANIAHNNPVLVEEAIDLLSTSLEGDRIVLDYDKHLEDSLKLAFRALRRPLSALRFGFKSLAILFSRMLAEY